jgi:hypothetical protein
MPIIQKKKNLKKEISGKIQKFKHSKKTKDQSSHPRWIGVTNFRIRLYGDDETFTQKKKGEII